MHIRKKLPTDARVDQLKAQARNLLAAYRAGSAEATDRVRAFHPRCAGGDATERETPSPEADGASKKDARSDARASLLLADAQLVIAREYGFATWTDLRQEIEAIDLSDPRASFFQAACVPTDGSPHTAGSLDRAAAILAEHPEIAECDIFHAAILGNDVAVGRFLHDDRDSATATGGLYDWDALTCLCFSRYLRLDPTRSEGFVRSARLLLDHGASANTGFYSQGRDPKPSLDTAIYGAAGIANHADLTRLLLEHGADPNDGETAYHVPERYDNAVMKILVESGKVDATGITTMLARKHDWHDYDGIAWLLAHGADPNAMSAWGRRAIHQALERDNPPRFVELLLEHGADPLLPARSGKSAIAVAARMGRADVLHLFTRRGLPIELSGGDALLLACTLADEPAARAMVARDPGLLPSTQAADPAILADVAGSGNEAAVRLMLDLGFDVSSRTTRAGAPRDTALHIALWRSRTATVRLLIERGAPLEALNDRNETPLAYAVRGLSESEWPQQASTETITALLEAGARVESVERFSSGNDEVDGLLRRYGRAT